MLLLQTDAWKITQKFYELHKADEWIELDLPDTIFKEKVDREEVNKWNYNYLPNMIFQLDKRFCTNYQQ